MSDTSQLKKRVFQTTVWTEVYEASSNEQAMGALYQRYRRPLLAHLMRVKGFSIDKAEDLLQGLFTDQIIEKTLFEKVQKSRGRFRSFLLNALDFYVKNQQRADNAQKRSPSDLKQLDEALAEDQDVPYQPHDVFDLHWARDILKETILRMYKYCQSQQQGEVWGMFRHRILEPLLFHTQEKPYEELVENYGFKSPLEASNSLVTAKRLFKRTMATVMNEYGVEEKDFDKTMKELKESLARAASSGELIITDSWIRESFNK